MPRKKPDDLQLSSTDVNVSSPSNDNRPEKKPEEQAESKPNIEHAESSPSTSNDRLTLARQKLSRMEETNKICFRHRNDLAAIEQELGRLGYGESEIEHLMEPKGAKMIPGFGFAELERQRQFVNFISSKRSAGEAKGFSESEDQRRDAKEADGPAR